MNIFLDAVGANKLAPRQILKDPVLFLAFGFGSGLAKKAPGTFGTVAAIPVYCLFAQSNLLVYSILTLLVTVVGIWICGVAADKLGEHDFGGIVWDEIAGYLITLWLVPFSWAAVFWGFILFRIFDILKPWPIRWLDRNIHGGLGIMLDDVLAGIFAGLLLWLMAGQGWLH
ncbi:phosphatidylglycerophosphatase A family protein [Methylovulum miyakonense]|uniref:phosphatidylglycerophosphatase A family protein n=1 Tax=Methylovulum miyakonense TaxID=645578 RepID=UPI00036A6D84|nr:phosphatidylglycerophosphatase A [Methylovulum miyakonense]